MWVIPQFKNLYSDLFVINKKRKKDKKKAKETTLSWAWVNKLVIHTVKHSAALKRKWTVEIHNMVYLKCVMQSESRQTLRHKVLYNSISMTTLQRQNFLMQRLVSSIIALFHALNWLIYILWGALFSCFPTIFFQEVADRFCAKATQDFFLAQYWYFLSSAGQPQLSQSMAFLTDSCRVFWYVYLIGNPREALVSQSAVNTFFIYIYIVSCGIVKL